MGRLIEERGVEEREGCFGLIEGITVDGLGGNVDGGEQREEGRGRTTARTRSRRDTFGSIR